MKRRNFTSAVGAGVVLSLSGCTGTDSETEDSDGNDGDDSRDSGDSGDSSDGNNDNPIDADPADLLPSAEIFGDGWKQHDNEVAGLHSVDLEGDNKIARFTTDDFQEAVDLEITIFDSVDAAMSGYQKMREFDFEDSGETTVEDVEIASEGHMVEFGASVYIRDANVIGALSHVLAQSQGRLSTAQEYTADWHETWRE